MGTKERRNQKLTEFTEYVPLRVQPTYMYCTQYIEVLVEFQSNRIIILLLFQ